VYHDHSCLLQCGGRGNSWSCGVNLEHLASYMPGVTKDVGGRRPPAATSDFRCDREDTRSDSVHQWSSLHSNPYPPSFTERRSGRSLDLQSLIIIFFK
jgi:hypothetical protein